MELTKYTHSCVVVGDGPRRLLIDPGIWTEPAAWEGVAEVLITHEHVDHLDVEALVSAATADSAFAVFGPRSVVDLLAAAGAACVAVGAGQHFSAGGFAVEAVGGAHAEIYDGLPDTANLGYLVAGEIYHPGDALHVPAQPVRTLLVPSCAPWLKLAEAVDFVRAVDPVRAYSIHDAMLSEVGLAVTDRWMSLKAGADYTRIPVGDSVVV